MKTLEDKIKDQLPKGSIYYGILETDDKTKTIVEYGLDGSVYQLTLMKLNLSDYFFRPININYLMGMHYEDLYALVNAQYGLGLVKEYDYVQTGEIVIPSSATIHLSISDNSLGYIGSIPVFLKVGNSNIINDGTNRDLRKYSFEDMIPDKVIQSKLDYTLFQSQDKLFTGGIISIAFKDAIKKALTGFNQEHVNDLVGGYVEKSFSDGLSDIIAVRTQKGYLYMVRFKSPTGDIPR